jgi:hypothetical protein
LAANSEPPARVAPVTVPPESVTTASLIISRAPEMLRADVDVAG